jgi:hypothetical protein
MVTRAIQAAVFARPQRTEGTSVKLTEDVTDSHRLRHCRRGLGLPRQTEQPRPSAHPCWAWVLLSTVLLIGCDALPRDSAGALNRVRGGELRVGVADHPPWVRFEGGRVAGLEPELIEM